MSPKNLATLDTMLITNLFEPIFFSLRENGFHEHLKKLKESILQQIKDLAAKTYCLYIIFNDNNKYEYLQPNTINALKRDSGYNNINSIATRCLFCYSVSPKHADNLYMQF